MSEAHPTGSETNGERGGVTTVGTEAAIESFSAMSSVSFQYVLPALLLTGIWWLKIGEMSAFAAGLGLFMLSLAGPNLLSALLSRRWPTTEATVVESKILTPREARNRSGGR